MRMAPPCLCCLLLLLMAAPLKGADETPRSTAALLEIMSRGAGGAPNKKSGVYVLEKGEESLLARAWLADQAHASIDIQYFIWSTDNVGILASEALLRAADRGVKVRVLVDDLLIDAPPAALLALVRHPNIDIRIYNPKVTVGTSRLKRIFNALTALRAVNQRMHDKTALFDGAVGITGGRNMADEYFDFDPRYNFRDRDVLVVGPVVASMEESFDRFWASSLAVPVEKLLTRELRDMNPARTQAVYDHLRRYAGDPENFAPEVREALSDLPRKLDRILTGMLWEEIRFVSDLPGKTNSAAAFPAAAGPPPNWPACCARQNKG
jgi:cardiolipin synthase C